MSGSTRQWYCTIGGQQYGPASEAEFLGWIQQGRVGPNDLVWTEELGAWRPLHDAQFMFPAGVSLPPTLKPHRGVLILVLGIVSLFVSFLGIMGAVTWYLANQDLPELDGGRMDPAGRGMTVAGKVCGIIGFALGILGCCWAGIWLTFVVGMFGANARF